MSDQPSFQKIVVVDDSATARKITVRCLSALGYGESEFFEAPDGEKGLALIKEERPDLVVSDLNMPIMDGVSMLRKVKASPLLHDIPVVVVSSILGDAQIEELTRRGVMHLIDKPLKPPKLREVLDKIAEEPHSV